MSDNVGLSTPRGSGTSGYVQRNLAHMKPRDRDRDRDRDRGAPYPRDLDHLKHRQRQPDKGILEHDRKREVEVKVFELRDQLEDEGVEEDEIDRRCDALRKELRERMTDSAPRKVLKSHQVHELAEAKIKESERLRSALKISKDYEEGGHWRRQEERLRKALDRQDEPARRDSR
ncbi:pre-mRNA splicing factor CWC21 [Nemania sp. NC0429]|nr:pre-mRNA splicing factor CWC21 [Nemania sp. NC0429]